VDPLDTSNQTPLHHAVLNGHLNVVKFLVEKGANVKLKNNEGLTATEMARSKGYSAVADWLNT
jgi:ankyrin repeat protein